MFPSCLHPWDMTQISWWFKLQSQSIAFKLNYNLSKLVKSCSIFDSLYPAFLDPKCISEQQGNRLSVKNAEGTNFKSVLFCPSITILRKNRHSKSTSFAVTCVIALGYHCHLSEVKQPPHSSPVSTSTDPASGDESNISGLELSSALPFSSVMTSQCCLQQQSKLI